MNHLTEEQLNEYMDHESQERAQIESHLSTCAECAAQLTALQTVFSELDSLTELTPSRDLAAAVMRRLGRTGVLPKWLTLTIALQAALAIIALFIATPFAIEFASDSLPVLHMPSMPEVFIQLQSQWMTWLDALSKLKLPSLPTVPSLQLSSVVILLTLAGASMMWLVGNGLLLRNQIK